MQERVDVDDAATDAPNEEAMQMREDTAGQHDLAAIGDVINDSEGRAAVNVSDQAVLPRRQASSHPRLDAARRSLPA